MIYTNYRIQSCVAWVGQTLKMIGVEPPEIEFLWKVTQEEIDRLKEKYG